MSKQDDMCLIRHWFGYGSLQSNIRNDGVNESLLGELNAPVLQTFDVNSHIVGWVTLVLNLKFQVLKVSYDC